MYLIESFKLEGYLCSNIKGDFTWKFMNGKIESIKYECCRVGKKKTKY